MCLLLVDAMVWNYVAKARALTPFLNALDDLVTLHEIVDQLEPALHKWPELHAVLDARNTGLIDAVHLTHEEEVYRIELLEAHPGLGMQDCALITACISRNWRLLNCDDRLSKKAALYGVHCIALPDVLDEAVNQGHLRHMDKEWIMYYLNGGTERRP